MTDLSKHQFAIPRRSDPNLTTAESIRYLGALIAARRKAMLKLANGESLILPWLAAAFSSGVTVE
jgi:hypothetical protein